MGLIQSLNQSYVFDVKIEIQHEGVYEDMSYYNNKSFI